MQSGDTFVVECREPFDVIAAGNQSWSDLGRLRFQPQPLVGNYENVTDRHGRDVRGWDKAVNAAFPLEITGLSSYRSLFVRTPARIKVEASNVRFSLLR